jgi:hypothetical protein
MMMAFWIIDALKAKKIYILKEYWNKWHFVLLLA